MDYPGRINVTRVFEVCNREKKLCVRMTQCDKV